MKRLIFIITLVVAIVSGAILLFQVETKEAAADQLDVQSILNTVSTSLNDQGIQIKSIGIVNDDQWNPSNVVKCVMQSSSSGAQANPSDAISFSLIFHEINMAQLRGLKIGAIDVSVINALGDVITESTVKAKNIETASRLIKPFKLDNVSVKALLSEKKLPKGFLTKDIRVTNGSDNLRKAIYVIEVPDIVTANGGISEVMIGTMQEISNLNDKQDTQIAVYQIDLVSSSGEILLKYLNDIFLKSETSWQNNALSEWYPHPAK
jgi:hypothetical protein